MRRPNIDHGWAWVVMMTSYLGMTIYCITLYMGGVIYVALLDKFKEGEVKTSLVGALSGGFLCFAAPFAGIIINRFSCRVAIMTGGAMTTIGFGISAVVPSLNWIIFSAGALVGIGYSISSAGLICVLGFYFEKRRDLMISLAFLVVGVGMFISTPLALLTLEHLGLSGSFFTFGAINAQMCVFGVLSRPSVLEQEVQAKKKVIRMDASGDRTKSYLDLSLLKQPSFLLYLCSTAAWNFALNVCIIHLPNYVNVLGGNYSDTGQVMMAFAVANIVGRLSGALTVSKFSVKSVHVHIATLTCAGILTSTFPFYARVPLGLYMFTVQLGVLCGWPNSMMTPISISFVGISKLSEAYGLSYLFCGVGVSAGPVIIGYLYSATRSYEYSFVASGGVLLLGSACGLGALCLRKDHQPQLELDIPIKDKETLLIQDPSVTKFPGHDIADYKKETGEIELEYVVQREGETTELVVQKKNLDQVSNGWEVHIH